MCEMLHELVPIPPLLWENGAIFEFDPAHPEYGINEAGERCLCLDSCIVPAIKALWAAGVVTVGCCCGHDEAAQGVISVARPADLPLGRDHWRRVSKHGTRRAGPRGDREGS